MKNEASFLKVLSLRDLIFFGLSFMAPATVFATYGIAAVTSNGMVATGYAITFSCIFLSALSYARFANKYPSSGSCFVFVKNSLGVKFGFMVGWAIILDYILSPMISSLFFGIFMNAYFPHIPLNVFIVCFLVFVTLINILGIKMASNYNTVIVFFQILLVVLFIGFSTHTLINQGGLNAVFSLIPFYDKNISLDGLMLCIPILYFSFLGFDAVTTLAEETKESQKMMPKAIFSIVTIGGVIFVACSYFMQLIIPDSSSIVNPDAAAIQIMRQAGGAFLESFFMILTIFGTTASAIASGSSAARLLYAMGQDEVLPKRIFGHLSSRYRTPIFNIILIGIIGLSANFMDLTFATHLISFGVIFSFACVNLSLFFNFYIKENDRRLVNNLLLPLMGVAVSFLVLCSLGTDAIALGVSWMVLGFLYLLIKSRKGNGKSIELVDL